MIRKIAAITGMLAVALPISLGCAVHRNTSTTGDAHRRIQGLARCFDDAADTYNRLGVTWHSCVYHEMDRGGSSRIIWDYDPDLGAQVEMITNRLQQRNFSIHDQNLHGDVTRYMVARSIRTAADELRDLVSVSHASP